jgi:small subunit ribosomal protein S8
VGIIVKLPLLGKINNCGVIKPRFACSVDDMEKFEKRFLPAENFGIILISTSKGLMTLDEARKENIGGRLVAFCY